MLIEMELKRVSKDIIEIDGVLFQMKEHTARDQRNNSGGCYYDWVNEGEKYPCAFLQGEYKDFCACPGEDELSCRWHIFVKTNTTLIGLGIDV